MPGADPVSSETMRQIVQAHREGLLACCDALIAIINRQRDVLEQWRDAETRADADEMRNAREERDAILGETWNPGGTK